MAECSCCQGSGGCCSGTSDNKKLIIDFLYLDLNVCERCKGTDKNLDEALSDVSAILKSAGYVVEINKININTKELAYKYEFLSSPTIRINGKDIDIYCKETLCEDCGDLCGDNVLCRVWSYDGNDFEIPPKEFLVNAILKEIYSGNTTLNNKKENYRLPENLEVYFNGINNKN